MDTRLYRMLSSSAVSLITVNTEDTQPMMPCARIMGVSVKYAAYPMSTISTVGTAMLQNRSMLLPAVLCKKLRASSRTGFKHSRSTWSAALL